jgi:hypothetical protein
MCKKNLVNKIVINLQLEANRQKNTITLSFTLFYVAL